MWCDDFSIALCSSKSDLAYDPKIVLTFRVQCAEQHVIVCSVEVPSRALAHAPADQVRAPWQRGRPAVGRSALLPVLLALLLRLNLPVPLLKPLPVVVVLAVASQRQVARVLGLLRPRLPLLDAV